MSATLISEPAPRRSTDLAHRCSAIEFVVGLVAALFAFLVAHGSSIGVENFFTPIHHDDFTAMVGIPAFDIWQPRPVSTNFLYVIGPMGGGLLYLLYLSLWLACFALTPMLAFSAFSLRASTPVAAFATFAVSFAWLSLSPSVPNLQYLGLATNGLSYFFAFLAAVFLLRGPLRGVRLVSFMTCVVLSAFSKEDMAAFVAGVVVLCALRDLSRAVPLGVVVRKAAAIFAFALLTYALSVVHSRIGGSPFTAGTGFYTMATPFQNVVNNVLAFWATSPGVRIVIGVWAVALLALAFRALWRLDAASLGDLVAGSLPFALALPYLALPRFADYYTATFVPLMLASFAPILIRIGGGAAPAVASALLVGVPVAATVLFQFSDAALRRGQVGWHAETRKVSRHQIQELHRLTTLGLRECGTVAVTGVSASLGPFLGGSSAYVDRIVGAAVDWRIQTEAGTITESFAGVTNLADEGWVYVAAEDDARQGADCLLAFDTTGYAQLTDL